MNDHGNQFNRLKGISHMGEVKQYSCVRKWSKKARDNGDMSKGHWSHLKELPMDKVKALRPEK